jgi:hypothetical protein
MQFRILSRLLERLELVHRCLDFVFTKRADLEGQELFDELRKKLFDLKLAWLGRLHTL